MRAKMLNMARWQKLDDAKFISLPGGKRTVTLEINVDRPTRFDVVTNGVAKLLRAVDPTECPISLVFGVFGNTEVIPTTDGEVWYFTDDGDRVDFPVTTPSFTELEQRMEMTPEMEVTILKANLRREERLREQTQMLLLKRQRADAKAAAANPETGEIEDDEEPLANDEGRSEPATVAGNTPAPEPQLSGGGDAAKPAAATDPLATGATK